MEHQRTRGTDNRGTDRALALAVVAVPVLSLAAEVVSPPLRDGAAEQLAVIGRQPERWYWYTILLIASSAVLVPAALAIGHLAGPGGRRLTAAGSALYAFSAIVAVADAAEQLVTWQMVGPGADPAQMAALQERYDGAGGAALVFLPGAVALLAGTGLLTVALLRAKTVPAWAAYGFALGTLASLAGFMAASVPIIAGGALILLGPCLRMARGLAQGPALVGGALPQVASGTTA